MSDLDVTSPAGPAHALDAVDTPTACTMPAGTARRVAPHARDGQNLSGGFGRRCGDEERSLHATSPLEGIGRRRWMTHAVGRHGQTRAWLTSTAVSARSSQWQSSLHQVPEQSRYPSMPFGLRITLTAHAALSPFPLSCSPPHAFTTAPSLSRPRSRRREVLYISKFYSISFFSRF